MKMKRDKNKASSIWKGVRSIVNIQNSSKNDIKLLNDEGSNISDPKKIADLFNKYFVKVGPNIDERISKARKHFIEYMNKLKVNKTIFLTPATPQEIYNIISAFDIKKSLGPNSIPVYILKISNNFFSNKLTDIIYHLKLEFFQTYTSSQRLYQSSKKTIHFPVKITDPYLSFLFLARYLRKLSINACMISQNRTN